MQIFRLKRSCQAVEVSGYGANQQGGQYGSFPDSTIAVKEDDGKGECNNYKSAVDRHFGSAKFDSCDS